MILSRTRLPILVIAVTLLVMSSRNAFADSVDFSFSGAPVYIETSDVAERKKDRWRGRIGIGAGLSPDFLGAESYQVAIPVDFELVWNNRIFLENDKLGAIIYDSRLFKAGIISQVIRGREENDNERALAGLGNNPETFELGGFFSVELFKFFLTTELLFDVSDGHSGGQLEFELGYVLQPTSRLLVVPILSVKWASTNFMQTNFGVTPAQAAASLYPAFSANSGPYNFSAELNLEYEMTRTWVLKVALRTSVLLDDAAKSPIVRGPFGSRFQSEAAVSAIFLF